ncbi:hypothetical protein [Streptomyces sp. NPDC045251]
MCHADIGTARAPKAGPDAPVTPGHEAAGVIGGWAQGITARRSNK